MNAPITIHQRLELQINKLLEQLSSHPHITNSDLSEVKKAIDLGNKWHSGQYRDTGDWYFIHPVRVAQHCFQIYPDKGIVIAALLHDTLEDCQQASHKSIQQYFGNSIIHLVVALTKLKKESKFLSVERILKLAQKDSRVLLIKILDRIDNLQDLHLLKRSRQRRNAIESMIYAAVAEGIGMTNLAIEIRNHAFRVLYPRRYQLVVKKIDTIERSNRKFYKQIIEDLWQIIGHKDCLDIHHVIKTPYDFAESSTKIINVLKKMYILMEDPLDCYVALGKLHQNLPVIPLRFHDYIANPLANGWQGLTTSVICQGLNVDLWITTANFYQKNRLGIFGSDDPHLPKSNSYRNFIAKFTDLFSDTSVDLDEMFRNQYKDSFNISSTEQLQVCSPMGQIIQLHAGASALDYAYAIHSEIGNTCAGAIINEAFTVDPSYHLQEGNIVEIITDNNIKPKAEWLNWVIMPHSRKEILANLRKHEKSSDNIQ